MYGMLTNIWLIFMVNVGKYTIHASLWVGVKSSIYVIPKYHQDIPPKNGINHNPYISRSPAGKLQNSIDVDVCCWNPLRMGNHDVVNLPMRFMYLGKFI